jgi:hypothetical protein
MKVQRLTLVLAVLTLLVLGLSLPGSLREAYERGGPYLFSVSSSRTCRTD